MSFIYDEVVPWQRNYSEYVRMFALSENEFNKKIIGCGDGPANFNYEYNKNGVDVTSIDPIYSLSKNEIQNRIHKTFNSVISQTRSNIDKFNWDRIKSVEELERIRMEAMQIFVNYYDEGKSKKRYIPGELPDTSFKDKKFDLSVCSHFLFFYTDNLSFEFHVSCIKEMLKISNEVWIFSILDVNSRKSLYAEKLNSFFSSNQIEIHKVNYEFQKSGNELLIIK